MVLLRKVAPAPHAGFDNKQIKVASGLAFPVAAEPKRMNLVGPRDLHNVAYHFPEHRRGDIQISVLHFVPAAAS